MSHTTTDYKYIELDDTGIALITGSTLKVSELISHHLVYGWSPEERHSNRTGPRQFKAININIGKPVALILGSPFENTHLTQKGNKILKR